MQQANVLLYQSYQKEKEEKKNIVKTLEGEKAVVKSLISFAFVVIFSSEQQLAFLYGYMDLVV